MDGSRDSEFTEFVHGQWNSLYRTAYLLTGDHQAAEDLLQATLTKVYLRWSRIGGMEQPGADTERDHAVLAQALDPWTLVARLPNFSFTPQQLAAAYTPEVRARLAAASRSYDPDQVLTISRAVRGS